MAHLPVKKSRLSVREKRNIFDVIGWSGAALIVGAYLLNSFGVLSADDLAYQLMNLAGAVCILVFSVVWKAYPNVVTNAIWSIGAVVAIGFILLR
jgi:hypothetical protein